jgi:hypothetical protein
MPRPPTSSDARASPATAPRRRPLRFGFAPISSCTSRRSSGTSSPAKRKSKIHQSTLSTTSSAYHLRLKGQRSFTPSLLARSRSRCAPAPIEQIARAVTMPKADPPFLGPKSHEALAVAAMMTAVPTSECVAVRCQRKKASALPSRVTQSLSAITPDTTSIEIAAGVVLLRPDRPSMSDTSACVMGSIAWDSYSCLQQLLPVS